MRVSDQEQAGTPASGLPARKPTPLWLVVLGNLVVALAIVSLLQNFVVRVHNVSSGSMQTTLGVRDRVLSSNLPYLAAPPQRGEIVSRVPAAAVTAVDTTGAGDTFTGVLVARLAQGAAQADALAAASAAASLTVTRPGAAASMPTRAEIDAALATRWHPHVLTPPRAEAATR